MIKSEYSRVANRAIATGILSVIVPQLKNFRDYISESGLDFDTQLLEIARNFEEISMELLKVAINEYAETE